ncbi:MAG: PKD domain-containing protein [Candidatus Paceibacterota bacterium]|jgi:hypothetical protein
MKLKKFMPIFYKTLAVLCVMMPLFLLFFSVAKAEDLEIVSAKLNSQESNVTFNANNGKDQPLLIELTANQAVKFNTVAICSLAVTCTRTTAVKYFTQPDLSITVSKSWDGKTGGASPQVVADGEYKIVATMSLTSGGDSTIKEITPHIVVLSSDVGNGDNNNSTTTATTTTTVSVVSGGSSYSSHSSQTDLSDYEETTPSIGAGRKRLVVVGSNVDFRVEKSKGASGLDRYSWTFGDGSSAEGERVSHSYKFPGEYNVVLNGYWGGTQLVSRTKVLVEEAKVAITKVDSQLGFVEITNQGSKEINLGGWTLRGMIDFSLPLDTIIDAGKGIKFALDPKIFSATSSRLILISADGGELGKMENISVAELENKLVKLKEELITLQSGEGALEATNTTIGKIEGGDQKSATKIITLAPKLSWWQKMFRMSK